MFYPNGQKIKYSKNVITYKNRGMNLESLINDACDYYIEKDEAIIYKKPTPIGLVDVDYKKGEIKKAFFKAPSTFDYNGIYKGKYVDFEAKECCSKTSFPLKNIHEHQIRHLKRVLKHGAIAFLIISINEKYYLLKGSTLLEFMNTFDRKSIPIDYLEKNAYEIKLGLSPVLNFLKVLDDVYFKGENIYEKE